MGSRGGGWGVFGRGHLESISPIVLVNVDEVDITFGQSGQLRELAPIASP